MKIKMCKFRELQIFRERLEIFQKFQKWVVGNQKFFGPSSFVYCAKIIFSLIFSQKSKFANFAIRRFFANGLRYSRKFKIELLGTTKYCDRLVSYIVLKLFSHGFFHENPNSQISRIADFSRTAWDIQKISKVTCRGQKNIVTV